MSRRSLFGAASACCLLALTVAVWQIQSQTVARPQSPQGAESRKIPKPDRVWPPAEPKPAPANPRELAAAFSKPSPDSIADLKAIEQRVKALVVRVSPAVVAVQVGFGTGSGVIISEDGLVLTAGHVCDGPNRDVRFTFPDGTTAHGKTVGVDLDSDTGLMRIMNPGLWPHVALGDLEQTAIGNWVLALGHPGGFDLKRSLVVRLGRIIRLASGVVQTDCTISPGDSGGPLFDMHGRIIGIHSAISSSVAENFHVPITEFYRGWNQLMKAERRQAMRLNTYFGATVVDDATGCCLSAVAANGPAFKAGLKPNDLILKVDGREIKVAASFRRWVAESEPGETLALEVKRGTRLLSVKVKLEPEPGTS